MTRFRPMSAALGLIAIAALSGCSLVDNLGAAAGNDSTKPEVIAESDDPGTVDLSTLGSSPGVADPIAKETFDATSGTDTAAPGGTISVQIRSLAVKGKATTLRWAIRWDNDDKDDDATTSLQDLGAVNLPILTDTSHLVQYWPLCSAGSWHGTSDEITQCRGSTLVSPSDEAAFALPNHTVVEAWAVFPAPQDETTTVDVLLVDGWPVLDDVAINR